MMVRLRVRLRARVIVWARGGCEGEAEGEVLDSRPLYPRKQAPRC